LEAVQTCYISLKNRLYFYNFMVSCIAAPTMLKVHINVSRLALSKL